MSSQTMPGAIHEFFSKYGTVKLVHMPLDKQLKETQQHAFVTFDSMSGAQQAVAEADGLILDDSKIEVRFALKRPLHVPPLVGEKKDDNWKHDKFKLDN